jgi:hypothetical protein
MVGKFRPHRATGQGLNARLVRWPDAATAKTGRQKSDRRRQSFQSCKKRNQIAEFADGDEVGESLGHD